MIYKSCINHWKKNKPKSMTIFFSNTKCFIHCQMIDLQLIADIWIIYTLKKSVMAYFIDLLPHYINLVIYLSKCQCNTNYIDWMSQREETRINQHVSANIQTGNLDSLLTIGLLIAEHFIKETSVCPILWQRHVPSIEKGSLWFSYAGL